MLGHELATETLLEGGLRSGTVASDTTHTLLFFSVAERLQTDITGALGRVLREHSFQVLIVNKFILRVRMEYNVIALRAGKCEEHTCLLRCKCTQRAT